MGESDGVRRTTPAVIGLRSLVRSTTIGAAGLAAALSVTLAACAARGGVGPEAAPQARDEASPQGAIEAPAHEHAHGTGHQHDPAHAQHHSPAGHHGATHDLPATAGPGYTVADVQFMQHMIGHHDQAIVMARMARTHDASPEVRRLAEKIEISQLDEIELMERWLTERGQAVPTEEQRKAMVMPGMLTPEQLAQLDAARGREFDRLFLEFMIQHHRGALAMVEALFADPAAAQDPDLFRFATDVDADQRDEIYVMQGMLALLATTGGSEN